MNEDEAAVLAAEAIEAMATLIEDHGWSEEDLRGLVRDAARMAE